MEQKLEQKIILDTLMDEQQPRRLTRVEQARLEALKSFGCADLASVLQSAKKVSLKTKLTLSKKTNEDENKDHGLNETRRKSRRNKSSQAGTSILTKRQRLTKAELARIESLKSFENNSLADITNSSRRIVSKFLNKIPTQCNDNDADETKELQAKISSEPENVYESQLENDSAILSNTSSELLFTSCTKHSKSYHSTITTSDKGKLTMTMQTLLDINQKVLDKAKELDSPL